MLKIDSVRIGVVAFIRIFTHNIMNAFLDVLALSRRKADVHVKLH